MGEMLEKFQQLMNKSILKHVMEEDGLLNKFMRANKASD